MASAASDPGPILGRVDAAGTLLSADPALARIQVEAGGTVGGRLMIPQLATLARQSLKLGIPLSRSIVAAGADRDVDLRVRAEPQGGEIELQIQQWVDQPPATPRLAFAAINGGSVDAAPAASAAPPVAEFEIDAQLRLVAFNDSARAWIDLDDEQAIGQPITRLLRMIPDAEGEFALLDGLGAESDFTGQDAAPRRESDARPRRLSGVARRDEAGQFHGFRLHAGDPAEAPPVEPGSPADPLLDPAIDVALRSPLDRIISAADRIVDRGDGPLRSDYASYAHDIAAAARHLLSVVRTMGKGAGEVEVEPAGETATLPGLVDAAMALVMAQADESGVALVVTPAASAATVVADPRGAVQILVNILANAVRHSPPDSTVEILFGRSAGMATVTISDQGAGIGEADQARIFERYERIGQPGDGGTGLGLAISRRLARSMGGDITLDSRAGEGARFTLLLPSA